MEVPILFLWAWGFVRVENKFIFLGSWAVWASGTFSNSQRTNQAFSGTFRQNLAKSGTFRHFQGHDSHDLP